MTDDLHSNEVKPENREEENEDQDTEIMELETDNRPPLPAGHPETWGLISNGIPFPR